MNAEDTPRDAEAGIRKWRPINRVQRRILGVLVEKSKTTPDAYPMTLNSVTTAANQKSNRSPLMNLDPDEVQAAIDQLRTMGAVMEVHGDGRVPKFRHLLYDWLGAEKGELGVMAELLLRGHQTLGELRARASRMDEIADLQQLRPILDSLIQKQLVIELTPPGRGQLVSHNLYQPEELEKVRGQIRSGSPIADDSAGESAPLAADPDALDELRRQLSGLSEKVADILRRLERLEG